MPHAAESLPELLHPSQAALLVMECQKGVVLPSGGKLDALAHAVASTGVLSQIAKLTRHARACGVPVFYLTASRRADGRGSATNCPLLAGSMRSPALAPGSRPQEMVDELRPEPDDFIVDRTHGVSPFHGTELDPLLRNLGVRTVVATGVSVNVGILGLTIEAVNAGYRVVIPRQAVAGVPPQYVEDVFRYTLRLLATVADSDEVCRYWAELAEWQEE